MKVNVLTQSTSITKLRLRIEMDSQIPGPDNGIALEATTLVFASVSVILAVWRFTYRGKKKILSLSDAFLLLGLVSDLTKQRMKPLARLANT